MWCAWHSVVGAEKYELVQAVIENNLYEVYNVTSGNFIELKKFSHNLGQNWYRLVLIPKYRYPVFAQTHQRKLAMDAIDWICRRNNIELFTKEVVEDHVYLFVSCSPDQSIRRLVQLIKGGSSYYIRKNHPPLKRYKSLWSRGCMYRSVGAVNAEVVERYIKNSNHWSSSQRKLV